MSAPLKKPLGNAIVVRSFLYNDSGDMVLQPTSIKAKIVGPDNATVIDDEDMLPIASGKFKGGFKYIWQSAEDGMAGIYSARIKTVYEGYTSIEDIPELVELT